MDFDYEVPGGTYHGVTIRLGIAVPQNFPITPPGGIDFKPRMADRPVNTNAQHPTRSHPSKRYAEAGEYWSRPHPAWNREPRKNAGAYMAWVTTLWMTT